MSILTNTYIYISDFSKFCNKKLKLIGVESGKVHLMYAPEKK